MKKKLLIGVLFAVAVHAKAVDAYEAQSVLRNQSCTDFIKEKGADVVSQIDCDDPNAVEAASFKMGAILSESGCPLNEAELREVYAEIPIGCGGMR